MKVITTRAIGNIPTGSQGVRQQVDGDRWRVKITHKAPACEVFEYSLGFLPKNYFEPGGNC
ncbi:MAG: hypothetical protein ABJP45_06535 [Cyclobacteriaceae bacterium]